jgi:D-sedoheptulose 7-phosphate isomerase
LEFEMTILGERIEELNKILVQFGHESNEAVMSISHTIAECFRAGGKVLICGNGGSAADSQHFAAEFVSSFSKDLNRRALPALALTTNTSVITAYSNDFGYEGVFARQVEAFGLKGDVLIVISTSGNSTNCIKAVETARNLNLQTVAFTGQGGALKEIVNFNLSVPSSNTQHIQEAHLVAYHVISELVEKELFVK